MTFSSFFVTSWLPLLLLIMLFLASTWARQFVTNSRALGKAWQGLALTLLFGIVPLLVQYLRDRREAGFWMWLFDAPVIIGLAYTIWNMAKALAVGQSAPRPPVE